MRLTIIPGVLEVNIGRPPAPPFRLPQFEKQSLDSLLVAISCLRDTEGLRVRVYPQAVLNEQMLEQVPEDKR